MNLRECPTSDADLAWRYLHVIAAGPAAQVHFVGRGGRWAAGEGKTVDKQEATRQARYVCGTDDGALARTLTRCWHEAARLVTEHWAAIEAVAWRLYTDGSVSPERVREIVGGSA